jgi:hypothetical protein
MTQTAAQRRYVRLAGSMNKKASKLGRPGVITATDLAAAFLASDWTCPYCGVGIDPLHCSFDHVIPFDNNGLNIPENVVACCLSCQRSKGTKSLDQYQFARGLEHDCDVCGRHYKPRWADWVRGFGRTCSRACAGKIGGEHKASTA